MQTISVAANMRDANITFDSDQYAVVFDTNYRVFEIQNKTDNDIIASIYPDKTTSDDGIRLIKKNETGTLNHLQDNINTVYITGTGTGRVYIAAGNSQKSSFNGTRGGGDSSSAPVGTVDYDTGVENKPRINNVVLTSGTKSSELGIVVDDIADFPEALPADGGNAGTVNNHTVNADVPADAKFTDTVYTLPVADENNLGGIKSGGDISVSGGGTVTVNSVNGKTLEKDVPANAVFTDTVYNDTAVRNSISDIKTYIGYTDSDILGVQVDFTNKTFTRLAAAVGKNPGADFNSFPMFGGRRRCNVADNGTVNAYYGEAGYSETGSNGQVMVYQPAFYYKVVPLKVDPQNNGAGKNLRKANYYISFTAKEGFKLHPAFYDESGKPVDGIFLSAFEASIYDVSASAYLTADEQVADFTASTGDKLCSRAGVKPCSGKTHNLTRPNIEQLAKNRGSGWHSDTIKAECMNELLMLIEYAAFNMQTAIGLGVTSVADNPNTDNNSIVTGGTSSLGNSTGSASGTAGYVSVSYRGMENPWGNIWKFVYGINEYMDASGIFHGYICDDYNFAESKGDGNYKSIGFNPAHTEGYVSAFGYSEEYDWLFIASETAGDSNLPVGDYYWCAPGNKNQWRIALLGGRWDSGSKAGGFSWALHDAVGSRGRDVGGRLLYVPASKI